MAVALLAEPDRADPEAEEAGVVTGQFGFDRGEIQKVLVQQLAQLRIVLFGGAAPDREHAGDRGIAQAFAQHALPDHAGGAEQDDFQFYLLAPVSYTHLTLPTNREV